MKKYLIISFLFLLAVTPVVAKGSSNTNSQTGQATTTNNQNKSTVTPSPKTSVTPTGNQVKNQNQGQDKKVTTQTQEAEQVEQNLNNDFQKVSDQVHQLINTVGAKGGIGQQVKEIAQNQTKIQENLKSNLAQLQLRKSFVKFFLGSDKKTIQNIGQHLEENQLLIQQLEQIKTQTKNTADLEQIQKTIDLMKYQNTSLQDKINQEDKINGLFGWLTKLFNK